MRLDTSEPIPAHIRALVQTGHALLEPVGSGAISCLACGACHWATTSNYIQKRSHTFVPMLLESIGSLTSHCNRVVPTKERLR